MLSKLPVTPTIGVKDMDRAKKFYEESLGLELVKDENGWVLYKCGEGTMINIYTSAFAGTNQSTYVSWKVDNLEAEMGDLRDKGVTFEEYDMPDLKTENGIASWDGEKAAWFKDPDGNIIALYQM